MKKRSLASIAAATLAATLLLPGTAANAVSSNEDKLGSEVTTLSIGDEKAQAAVEYWTEERMANAVPLQVELPTPEGLVALGGSLAKGLARAATQDVSSVTQTVEGTSATASFLLDLVRRSKSEAPVSNIGKVFFSQGDTNYVCSGNVVTSYNGSTVSTAGHCVNSGENEYYTNFVFVPAYENGKAPYGKWPALSLNTTAQWANGADLEYDTAFVKVAKLGGKTIQQQVGSSGVAFNQPRGLEYKAFGYPQAPPFDGQSLKSCQDKAKDDPFDKSTQGILCGKTGGTSGGPWFIGPDPKGKQNSINSYGYVIDPTTLYGPYWGSTIQAVYNKVSRS